MGGGWFRDSPLESRSGITPPPRTRSKIISSRSSRKGGSRGETSDQLYVQACPTGPGLTPENFPRFPVHQERGFYTSGKLLSLSWGKEFDKHRPDDCNKKSHGCPDDSHPSVDTPSNEPKTVNII